MIVPVQKDEAFLRDFQEADKVTGAVHVWWMGQSGFLVKWNGIGILIDPYLSDSITRAHRNTDTPMRRVSERVIDPLKLTGVNFVVCSSDAPDRLDPETIMPLRAANPDLRMVVPAGISQQVDRVLGNAAPPIHPVNAGTYTSMDTIDFHGIDAANPKMRRDEEGNSKDIGFVIVFGPFAIYHSGETVWHTHLVKQVRRWTINLSFLPINGEVKTGERGDSMNGFEAAALAKAVSSSIVIPCHYDLFDVGNVTTDEFSTSCERLGQRSRVLRLGQRMTMGPLAEASAGKAMPSEPHRTDWGLGY
ncbi:MAG: MBL fold metallo-hydrolase [Verrucomicrobiales bacterium]|nr:MBL fold metallo-hydrolase [Verrucomicrobiales bacterium]